MSLIFDTHAHYDDEAFDADRETLLASMPEHGVGPVSYTHLDVYKRQEEWYRRVWLCFVSFVGRQSIFILQQTRCV